MSYHWRHGVLFERFDGGETGGTVRVRLPICPDCGGAGLIEQVGENDVERDSCVLCDGVGLFDLGQILVVLTIPAAEWASIIASVSAIGETAEQYADALSFHGELIGRREPAGG